MGMNGQLAKHYAHRGFHDKPAVPENSLAAFSRAASHGYPVEFDVHLIADGSLVVFHDDDMERETGVPGLLDDMTLERLSALRLEGTDEKIPTFDEVLSVFEDTGLPLLIELKPSRGNHKELADKVCERLSGYRGEYVLESFDPRALLEVRKVAPDTCVGQLAQDFIKKRDGVKLYQAVILKYMMYNVLVRPDFIAYRFPDIGCRPAKSAIKRGVPFAVWTIDTPRDYRYAIEHGLVPIFERFEPKV